MRSGGTGTARALLGLLGLIGLGSMAVALAWWGGSQDAQARPRRSRASSVHGRDLSMPGPARRLRAQARIEQNAECVNCHAEVAAEWRGSLHAQAYTDPLFQVSFERENFSDFCQGCHAPEASPRGDVEAERGAVGVGCVSCHLVGEEQAVLASPRASWVEGEERAPHALRRDPKFTTAQACAGCHEFDFPNARRRGDVLKMQRTVTEHRRSKASEHSCHSCHMPPTAGDAGVHRSHAFPGARSPMMVRSAAKVSALREPAQGEGQGEVVVVTLEPRVVGHAFPTGDLFRRIEVTVAGPADEWTQTRYLARHFGIQRQDSGGVLKIEVGDDRVGIEGRGDRSRSVRVRVPEALAGRALTWRVEYQRVLDTPVGAEARAEVWDRTELASGQL